MDCVDNSPLGGVLPTIPNESCGWQKRTKAREDAVGRQMTREIQIGDLVMFLKNRPVPDSSTCIEAHPARTFGEEATKRERMLYPSLVGWPVYPRLRAIVALAGLTFRVR